MITLHPVARIVLLVACVAMPVASAAARQPNIILLVADDQGYAEMSCQGGDVPTPHLDALAKAGVRCTAGYVTAPYCSPSRAGFLTGRYQQRFGHELNPVQKMNDLPHVGLPATEKTLADRLRAAGYVTGMVGKWHLGNHPPFHPQKRGFDEFFGFLREGHFYLPPPYDGPADRVVSRLRANEPEYDRLNPILRGTQEVAEPRYLTTAIAQEAVAFVKRHRERPFFLYVPFNAPHSPMQADPKWYAKFDKVADPHRRVWAAMLWAMDDAVGQVLAEVKTAGLERDTLVIFLSDNGGPTAELTSRNDPFSGGKGSLLEGGIRVPFIVSWPGRVPAGAVYERPVSALDIVPTALAAVGAPAKPDDALDGVDLLPFFARENKADPHEALYWRMGEQAAIRKGDWKLVRYRGASEFKLFNVAADRGEKRDRAGENPGVVADLRARFEHWDATLVKPLWGSTPPK